ncbi:Signal transduction histidine kinase [Amycolatopsis xylanica]|uniref:histidine kinase n=1 Tax=Amycolatopsis xylanica TaxID=589385 RepID=A0A1H3CTE1_9PSEU|nr:sensor histidine kinase [Amycolatopsis xylanica]SDX57431.1 Signal transduction histidine kinase [Amycolatopsis xylanica]
MGAMPFPAGKFGRLRRFRVPAEVLAVLTLIVLGMIGVRSGFDEYGYPEPVAVAVWLAGPLSLLLRRGAPFAVLIVALIFPKAAELIDPALQNGNVTGTLTAFVAVGSAGYYARWPFLALVLALLMTWIPMLVAHLEMLPPIGDFVYHGTLMVLAWLVGHSVKIGALRAQLSQQRAAASMAEERVRIARELHDVVAHSISVMTLHAGGARRLLRSDQRAEHDALEVVEQTGRQAQEEMQRVLQLLRTPLDEPPVDVPRLTDAAELLRPACAAGLTARLHVIGEPRALEPGVDLSCYRILQEALTNVLKHAKATRVDATIHYEPRAMRLEITDDGSAASGKPCGTGHGLIGMRERAALYGGTLEAGPLPERGFRITATIPTAGPAR